MCHTFGIKCRPTTFYNIIERVHQVMGNMLRTFEVEDRYLDHNAPWDEFLQDCDYCIRSNYHTTLQASPGQLGHHFLIPWSPSAWLFVDPKKYWAHQVFYI
jgi:hypothetical protein